MPNWNNSPITCPPVVSGCSKLSPKENEGPKNYFTINKKVEGGALVNFKKEESFSKEELDNIRNLDGVKRIGGFTRNQFPLTLYIWPTGKIGLGAAAKTDLFFESIPDEFLDFIPEEWDWEENSSLIPIMVPKFYLDLWNFGLALTSRISISLQRSRHWYAY